MRWTPGTAGRAQIIWSNQEDGLLLAYHGARLRGLCTEVGALLVSCQFYSSTSEPLHPTVVSWPFEAWGLDVMGPITPKSFTGHSYILAVTDYFSNGQKQSYWQKSKKKMTLIVFKPISSTDMAYLDILSLTMTNHLSTSWWSPFAKSFSLPSTNPQCPMHLQMDRQKLSIRCFATY